MGETRDEYVHRAKEAGEEYLEQGKRVVMAASDAAKEQTGKAGLTPEDAEQRRRETEERPERVSPVARHTTREETTR